MPVWLAGRSIAFDGEFVSQGIRPGRDVNYYSLEDMWGNRSGQFMAFAQNILDRLICFADRHQVARFAIIWLKRFR